MSILWFINIIIICYQKNTLYFQKKSKNIKAENAFTLTTLAKKASKKYGNDKVINCTIGSLYDENENFFINKTVKSVYSNIEPISIFSYANGITGSTDYKNAIKEFTFGNELKKIKSYIDVTSTIGGTGAIFLALKMYSNNNDTILLPNYMWEAYIDLTLNSSSKYETYNMFKDDKFDINDLKTKINNVLKKQDKVIVVINDPAHNPTGYSMTDKEWNELILFLKSIDKKKKVILLNEISYLDYDYRGYDNTRKHFAFFDNLPSNILILIATSISKVLTSYGLRCGSLIAISKDKNIIEDFSSTSNRICRSTWSNIPKGSMEMFVKIIKDKKIYNDFIKEKDSIIKILKKRSDIFIKEAKKLKLNILPYSSGFFITIPLKKKDIISVHSNLKKRNVFVLPLLNGIRIAICSVPTKKIPNLVKILKECVK